MEKRKIDFLLMEAGFDMERLDSRFAEIDKRMANVNVGTNMIDMAGNGFDTFPVTVTKIVDREQGIVEVYEESINEYRQMPIQCLKLVK